MSTFFTPSRRCIAAPSRSRNAPLDSTTTSTPADDQSMAAGSEPSKTRTSWPSMEKRAVAVGHLGGEAAVVGVVAQQVGMHVDG